MEYNQRKWLIRWLAVIAVMLGVLGALLAVFGYGTLHNTLPGSYKVTVNGTVVTDEKIKLRPGSYHIAVYSSKYKTERKLVKIGLFGSQKLNQPNEIADPNNIVSSVIAASGMYGPPQVAKSTWLLDDTWLVGNVGPGSIAQVALHYTDHNWRVKYFEMTGYPRNKNVLPNEVVNALERTKPSVQ